MNPELDFIFENAKEPFSLEEKPFASRLPLWGKVQSALAKKSPAAPRYSNAIRLETIDENLYLGFGYAEARKEHFEEDTRIVINARTAKQLLLTLAELFECSVEPKKAPSHET